jgi:hypothetical protein
MDNREFSGRYRAVKNAETFGFAVCECEGRPMTAAKPLWRLMLQDSDKAIEGREFESLSQADRIIAAAHIMAVADWLTRSGYFSAARLLRLQAPSVTSCDDPPSLSAFRAYAAEVSGEASGPADTTLL